MTTYTPARCAFSVMVSDPIVSKILFLDTGNFPSYSSYLNETLEFSYGNWGSAGSGGPAGGSPLNLASAVTFGALSSSTLTNTGPTTVNGDIGLFPGTSITGFPPGTFEGVEHLTDPTAAQAEIDALAAYTAGQALPGGTTIVAGTYGNGTTVTPGIYTATSSLNFTGGTVTLDAQGNPNASWVFQINSTLVTAAATTLRLVNGAQPQNIFFLVGSSATLGTTTNFAGNIIAHSSVTDNGGSIVTGRLFALTGSVTLNDTTIFVPQSTNVGPFQNTPFPPRTDHAMAFDGYHVMMFGGRGASSTAGYYQDTWIWGGAGWTQVGGIGFSLPGPNGRYKSEAAYLPGVGAVMFGGETTLNLVNGTWIFNGSTWTQVTTPNTTAGRPAGRTGHSMAGSASEVLLFGGRGDNGQYNDTWAFNGSTWTQLFPANSPPVRSEASLSYDGYNGIWVLFGGQNEYQSLLDTWTFNGSNWTQVSVPNGAGPYGRFGAQMAWDVGSGTTIMFGGIGAHANYPSNETWSFNGATLTWTKL